MSFRMYDHNQDRADVHRIWEETGWLEEGKETCLDLYVTSGRSLVADIDGSPECLVITHPGTIHYLDEELPFASVSAVTTSAIARKQRLARKLTSLSIAQDVADGAMVVGLGMFEQGYYNTLGFGSGSYENWISFDPAHLTVDVKPRMPHRVVTDDWEKVHASRVASSHGHGSISIAPPQFTRSAMLHGKSAFGLGYFDGPKRGLTHHFWARAENRNSGPYHIAWMTWQTPEQFLEIMGLIKSLGDQVHLVKMREPQGIQLQDLLKQPLKQRYISRKSEFPSTMTADAYWQVRICDLPGCLARTHLSGGDVRFNLSLEDPITAFLDEDAPWHGTGGEYVVMLGEESSAVPGTDNRLPTLSASVGTFTRMWLGIRPPSGLAITDCLSGPPELLSALDRVLYLPTPKLGWDI